MNRKTLFLFVVLMPVLLSFEAPKLSDDVVLTGTWVRKSDNLRIQVSEQGDRPGLYSFIVAEGIEKFPCEVSDLPIYKNISKKGRNLWTCDFLVVTMGSCATEYEEGIVRLTREGNMEIICPGFDTKYYEKLRPRLEP